VEARTELSLEAHPNDLMIIGQNHSNRFHD
jgi:hypothetical protein